VARRCAGLFAGRVRAGALVPATRSSGSLQALQAQKTTSTTSSTKSPAKSPVGVRAETGRLGADSGEARWVLESRERGVGESASRAPPMS
jgi:hypothetical protein